MIVDIKISLSVEKDVDIDFNTSLGLRISCTSCHRKWRTVFLNSQGIRSVCTPSFHQFPGNIIFQHVTKDFNSVECFYKIIYDSKPFFDPKYRKVFPVLILNCTVSFTATCNVCGFNSKQSSQYSHHSSGKQSEQRCRCGALLYSIKEPITLANSTM